MKTNAVKTKKIATQDLVLELSRDLQHPSESQNWSTQYWFSWISCCSMMALLTYIAAAVLPTYIHFPTHWQNFSFWLDTVLWFLIAFFSAQVAYQSSVPGAATLWLQLWLQRAMGFVFALVLISVAFRSSPSAMAAEFPEELSILRGPCGMFIFVTGLVAASWMHYVMKRAAPIDLRKTSVWGAISVGALGSMFMHLVCTHENSLHVFVWHVAPLFLLMAVAATFGQRMLRW